MDRVYIVVSLAKPGEAVVTILEQPDFLPPPPLRSSLWLAAITPSFDCYYEQLRLFKPQPQQVGSAHG